MKVAERDQMLQEVHQGIWGVKGTEDKGLMGDFKELKEAVKEQNGRHHKLSKKVNILIGALVGSGLLTGGGIGIAQLLGG